MAAMNALVTSGSGTAGVSTYPRPYGRPGGGAIDTAAKALGLTRENVIDGLKQGKSLDDLADAQGVSRDDLRSALKQGMPAELANSGKADDIADRIATQKGLPGNRPRGVDAAPKPGADGGTGVLGSSLTEGQQKTLDKLSNLLGTDSTSLLKKLQDGTSLSTLTAAAGVSSSSLASILQDGLMVDTHA